MPKARLVKKGSPHPQYPSFKLHSAHMKEKDADKMEHDLLEGHTKVNGKSVDETRTISIPRQTLVYARLRNKAPRITPKQPKLKR